MSQVYLSLGSNVDAEYHIRAGISALESAFEHCEISPIYRSRAVGFEGDDFINLAAMIETDMDPDRLRAWLRDLEDRHGRDRDRPRFSDRTLDIDILLIDKPVVCSTELDLPRGEILRFAHVLKPLSDLAPDLMHPTENKSLRVLWRESGLSNAELEEIQL